MFTGENPGKIAVLQPMSSFFKRGPEFPIDLGHPGVAPDEGLRGPQLSAAALHGFGSCHAHAPSVEDGTEPKDLHLAGDESTEANNIESILEVCGCRCYMMVYGSWRR